MDAQCVRRRLGHRRGGSSECAPPPCEPSRGPRGQNRSTRQAVPSSTSLGRKPVKEAKYFDLQGSAARTRGTA
jgi:hypothetical protein